MLPCNVAPSIHNIKNQTLVNEIMVVLESIVTLSILNLDVTVLTPVQTKVMFITNSSLLNITSSEKKTPTTSPT